MQSRNALTKNAWWQTLFPLIAILGLGLAMANGAHDRAASGQPETSFGFAGDALAGVPAISGIGLSSGFTMADFTGDTHPDLAIVELNGFDSGSALYMVDVRFSEGGSQFLQLKAPFGGLLITAKDVTGDGNLDLVIRAAQSGAPLTIFLNDGHGHFTAAEPSAFTNILPENPPERKFTTKYFCFISPMVSPRCGMARCQNQATRNPDAPRVSVTLANSILPPHPFLTSGSDRAPPKIV